MPYLRSQDAGLRAAAIEALQALPEAIAPFMAPLLSDSDSDVRLLATELARNMKASEATRLLCDLDRARATPQCLRRGDRRTDGSWNAGGASYAGKMCGAFCCDAVPAVRDFGGDCSHIGRGRLGEMDDPKGGVVACRPYHAGGSPALLRISLPPHRHVVHGGQAIFYRSPPRGPHRCHRLIIVSGVFFPAEGRCRPRDRASDQFLHR